MVESQISMTLEVSKLLSWAVLDTSGLTSGSSNPKRPGSLALATTLPLKLEDSAKQVDTSSQVRFPDNTEMDDPTLEEIHVSPSSPVETSGPSGEAPSWNVTQLQEEANKALGHLLVTRSSIDAHWRKQVSVFEMALCQNESQTTEAIMEAKALCAHTIQDAETHQTVLINKAEVQHTNCIKEIEDDYVHALAEAENCCSTAIRESESRGTSKTHSIPCQRHPASRGRGHWRGGKGPPHLPCHLQHYSQGQPSRGPWHNGYPLPPTTRKCPCVYPVEHCPRGIPSWKGTCSTDSSFLCPSSNWTLILVQVAAQLACPSPSGITSKVTPRETPHSKQKKEMPFHKPVPRSHQKVFSRDSRLVQKAREDYYQENCLHFNSETSCIMVDIFWSMIKSASPLCSEIYEIQESWTGQCELQYTNYTLNSLLKGLKFFCPVSPSESPKAMGLTGIHHPDPLHHFNGVIHCPWCRKEGQNEGTIINHLQMTHYKLGLVCEKCFHCSLVTSEAIWHHGHKSCQLSIDRVPNKSFSLA